MISPMYRVVVAGSDCEKEKFILDIASTRLVHLEECPKSTFGLETKQELEDLQESLIEVPDSDQPQECSGKELREIQAQVVNAVKTRQSLTLEYEELQKNELLLSHFGSFSPQKVDSLKANDLDVFFVKLPAGEEGALKDFCFFSTDNSRESVYGVLVQQKGQSKKIFSSYIIDLPNLTLADCQSKIADTETELKRLKSTLAESAPYKTALEDLSKDLERKIHFASFKGSFTEKDQLTYIQGWCPQNSINEMAQKISHAGYGLYWRNPEDDEDPPVRLVNPKWIDSSKPLYKLINSFPGYNEQDISSVFLLFSTLFFAVLVGDAGYGVLTLGATIFGQLKFKDEKFKEVFKLGWFFSIATIVWGALSGNWFGLEYLSHLPLLESMIIPSLNAFSPDSQQVVMLLCFIIGAIHISIAHIMRFFKVEKGAGLAEIGWIGVVWVVFFLVRNLVLGESIPFFINGLLTASLLIIAFFAVPVKKLYIRVGKGLASIPMKLMSCFADSISYIRLFAVGMATLAVARSFNEIAMDIGFNSVLTSIGAVLILLLGHGVNICMAALSVIVHGLRLNMLEFSNHLGLEWSGIPYKPLKLVKGE